MVSNLATALPTWSLPSRGAWIEMIRRAVLRRAERCRSLRGERGLKWKRMERHLQKVRSLPSRGAWIEIYLRGECMELIAVSLPSRGAWIEIGGGESFGGVSVRRSLRGERGLKLDRALSVLRPGRRFLRGDRGLRTGLCT